MDSFEQLLERLRKKVVEDASAIDPGFAASVAAERKEIEDHEKFLESQRIKQEPQPPIELRRPTEEPEPGESEKEILERVNRAVIERREL